MIPVGDFYILLGQMLVSPAILRDALEKIEPAYFNYPTISKVENGLPAGVRHALLFDTIRRFYEQHKQVPDRPTLESRAAEDLELHKAGDESFPLTSADVAGTVAALFSKMEAMGPASHHIARKVIEEMYRVCFFDPKRTQLIDEAGRDPARAASLESDLVTLTNSSKMKSNNLGMNNVLSTETKGEAVRRVETGIDFIDNLCGNGRDRGPTTCCSCALIGGQNSGKSSIGIQMMVAQAIKGKHAIIVLTEAPGRKGLFNRKLAACATGIPYPILEQTGGNIEEGCKLSGVNLDTAMEAWRLVDQFVHVIDLFEIGGGPDRAEEIISNYVTEGIRPEIVYIDWAGPLADYMMKNQKRDGRRYETANHALQAIGSWSAAVAGRYQTFVVVAHQMNTKAYAKGAFANNDMYCAMDCHAFTMDMGYCFVINQRDKHTGLQLFTIAKVRDDAPKPPVVVKLRGDIVKFEPALGYEQRGRQFKKTAPDNNAFPKEQQKRQSGETEG